MNERLLPIVVLISGRGSNLQAIIDFIRAGDLPVELRAVISNRPDAAGLEIARQANIHTDIVDHTHFPDRTAFEQHLADTIDGHGPALVVLAGFMRILGRQFVDHYRARMLNIHPSLLPDFPGLDTHRRAIEAGADTHGASVHFVTGDVDGGPVIAQVRVPVIGNDTADQLAARVLEQEHRLLPQVIRWFAEGRLDLDPAGKPLLDNRPLATPHIVPAVTETAC